jgi:hypothetical protein
VPWGSPRLRGTHPALRESSTQLREFPAVGVDGVRSGDIAVRLPGGDPELVHQERRRGLVRAGTGDRTRPSSKSRTVPSHSASTAASAACPSATTFRNSASDSDQVSASIPSAVNSRMAASTRGTTCPAVASPIVMTATVEATTDKSGQRENPCG